MYRSCLLINVGNNPDRPRPGRLWLRNRYHVHQRLCMAFPSAFQKADDPDFVKPFIPNEFGSGHVHVERAADSGFLFRIDPLPNGRAAIIVQSAIEPDWGYAFHNANHLLAAPPEVKPFEPRLSKGQCFRFRLAVNPTKKIDTIMKEERQNCTREELGERTGRNGKRVPTPPDQLLDWLGRRAKSAGFLFYQNSISLQPGYVYMDKKGNGQRLRSVLFNGLLQVTDPDAFRQTLVSGIGSGKAFGFGLLSIAPVNMTDAGEAI